MDFNLVWIILVGVVAFSKVGIWFARSINRPAINLVVACLCVFGSIGAAVFLVPNLADARLGLKALLLWTAFFGGGIAAVEKNRAMQQGGGDAQD